MNLYKRWISSPFQEMPRWLRGIPVGLAGGAGYLIADSVGGETDKRALVYAAVNTIAWVISSVLWRATHKAAGQQL